MILPEESIHLKCNYCSTKVMKQFALSYQVLTRHYLWPVWIQKRPWQRNNRQAAVQKNCSRKNARFKCHDLSFLGPPPYMGNIGPFLPQYLVRIPSTFVSFAIDNKLISLQSEVKTAYPGFLRLPLHKKFQLRVPNYFLRAIFPFWTIWNANKTWNDADRSKETKCRHNDVKMP